MQQDYDYIIVGSGFGGSVSALRLSEKGYKVLVIEKGKRWNPEQFPKTNWNMRKWMWLPLFRFHGFFKMTIMRHVGILSGVGVGGGSLVYANTLPRPDDAFYNSGSWSGLTDWKKELEPHYTEAERMLGTIENPGLYDSDKALEAVAIGSIFPPDKDTHLESVRYGSGSGFWKMLGVPLTHGGSVVGRILKLLWKMLTRPVSWLRIYVSKDFARESMILLFMQNLDSTLKFRRGMLNMCSEVSTGSPPSAFMPFARELAEAASKEIDGKPFVMLTEALTGTPTTAHILGGCVIGRDSGEAVIDKDQRVFGYQNMYVCDGSAISANPGVNPALTITAMTERVMGKIPEKK